LLPARSATLRLAVFALAVSVPLATLVLSGKLAWARLASPEVASVAVQPRLTSAACQGPSAAAHTTLGAVVSILTVTMLLGLLALPAISVTVCAVELTALPSALRI